MSTELLIALLSFLGTLLGAFGGIVASSKLTNFRLKELETQVKKHNDFARRMPVLEERINIINDRLKNLEAQR